MAATPLTSAKLAPYGSELVFHPNNVTDTEKRHALRAQQWPLATTIIVIVECMLVLLCLHPVQMSPQTAPVAYSVLAFATVVLLAAAYVTIILPLRVRHNLLHQGGAFWLPAGRTRHFYEEQSRRIENEVVPWHRARLHTELYCAVRGMRIQEIILEGDDTFLLGRRMPETNIVSRAQYNKYHDDLCEAILRAGHGQSTEYE